MNFDRMGDDELHPGQADTITRQQTQPQRFVGISHIQHDVGERRFECCRVDLAAFER